MSDFTYRPLTPNGDQIRLVQIFPRNRNSNTTTATASTTDGNNDNDSNTSTTATDPDHIECSISHVSLKNAPPYLALSYTWGLPVRESRITANGQRCLVTANLETALRHLRRDDGNEEPVLVWIDDLCINQQDDAEKSEQVARMRDIYTQASLGVLSWLGPAAHDSDLAMGWVRHFGQRAHNLKIGSKTDLLLRSLLNAHSNNGGSSSSSSSSPDASGQKDAMMTTTPLSSDMQKFLTNFEESWTAHGAESGRLVNALSKLLKRSYWSRMWIVQEFYAATNLELVCGGETASEEAFNAAIRLVRNYVDYRTKKFGPSHLNFLGADVDTSLYTATPINLFKVRRAGHALPLIYLLRILTTHEASDPRDKVFALLGIVSDAEALGLFPDYTLSCANVYRRVAKALLTHGYLEVLSTCDMQTSLVGATLPSWVTDWSTRHQNKLLEERSLNRRSGTCLTELQPKFRASGDSNNDSSLTTAKSAARLVFSDNMMSLTAQATPLGKITRIGRKWNANAPHQWLDDLVSFSPDASPRSMEAVWRTAVADQDMRSLANNVKPRLSTETVERIRRMTAMTMEEEEKKKGKKTDSSYLLPYDTTATMDQLLAGGLGSYSKQLREIARNRRPLLVDGRHLAIGPANAVVGDTVCIILGATVPSVLRRREHQQLGAVTMVGEVYVHGMMDGEAMEKNLGTLSLTVV